MQQTSAWRELVFTHLERILQSVQFKKSARMGRFLTYVVEQTVAHNPVTIRSYNIAVEVFNKGPDFDPGDPYVRNIARLTRCALKNYYSAGGANNQIRIDVPAGNYIATFTSRDSAMSGDAPEATARLDGEGFVGNHVPDLADNHYSRQRAGDPNPSIAVIPFRYQGSDTDSEIVIGEVLASGLIAGLSKSSRLNVISWLSSTQFRNKQYDIFAVSRRLNCDYVVSGNYVCRRGRLAMYIEIADCLTCEVIWAETRNSTVEKFVSVDADIIAGLTIDVTDVVLERETYRTYYNEPLETLSLHSSLIGGMLDMHSKNDQRFHRVKIQFDQILKRYPNHTAVNALLAQWYVLKINRGGGWQSGEDERNRFSSEAHLQTALEANPEYSLALTMSGLLETQFNKNPEKGLELYDAAERNNPNEPILMAYKAAALSYKGEAKEAIRYAENAFMLSPLDPQKGLFHTCAAAAYYADGDCKRARFHADNAYAINPAHTSNLRTLVAIQIDLGEEAKARSSARELLSIDPGFTTGSYLMRSPNAGYSIGKKIAERLEQAGVPAA